MSVSEVSKFKYLKGLLDGKAKYCILGLDTTAENYKMLLNYYMIDLLIPKPLIVLTWTPYRVYIGKDGNIEQLQEIYRIIENHTRNLNSFNISTKYYGPILNSVYMSKLPRGIWLDISRQMPAGKWDVVKLLDIFKRELVAREWCKQFEKLAENGDIDFEAPTTLYSNSCQKLSWTYWK